MQDHQNYMAVDLAVMGIMEMAPIQWAVEAAAQLQMDKTAEEAITTVMVALDINLQLVEQIHLMGMGEMVFPQLTIVVKQSVMVLVELVPTTDIQALTSMAEVAITE